MENHIDGQSPIRIQYDIGKLSFNLVQAIILSYHMKIKFSTLEEVWEAMGNRRIVRECYVNILRHV